MAIIHVDMRGVFPKLKLALEDYSKEVQRRALYNALNSACGPLLTAVRRHVTKQTSAKYNRVMSHIKAKKAHPNNLTYRIDAKDTAMPLSDFGPKFRPGQKNIRLLVWGKRQTFHGSFAVTFEGKTQIVKRVGPHGKKGERLNVKMLWGPIIPKEMLREGFPSRAEIERVVPERLLKRIPHELEQAVIRAKAASGT
jgi:hypothetical protein